MRLSRLVPGMCLVLLAGAALAESPRCTPHGCKVKWWLDAMPDIEVVVSATTVAGGWQPIAESQPGQYTSLGSTQVGETIGLQVVLCDKDSHVCQGSVVGRIDNALVEESPVAASVTDEADTELGSVTFQPGPVVGIWDGSLRITEAMLGKRLRILFSGTVQDVPCTVERHLASNDPRDADLTYYKATVVVPKVESITHSNPHCWDGGEITFTAVASPTGATFPSGNPTWTATVGSFPDGNTGPSVVWKAPTGSGGTAEITATCGSSHADDSVTYVHVQALGAGGAIIRGGHGAFTFAVEPEGAPVGIAAIDVPDALAVSIRQLSVAVENLLDYDIYAYLDNVASVEFELSLPDTTWLRYIGVNWDLKKDFRKIYDSFEKPHTADLWDALVDAGGDAVKDSVKDAYLAEGFPVPMANELGQMAKAEVETWASKNLPFPANVEDAVIDEDVTFSFDSSVTVRLNYGVEVEFNERNWPGWPDVTPDFESWLQYTVEHGFTTKYIEIIGAQGKMNVRWEGATWELRGGVRITTGNNLGTWCPEGSLVFVLKFH